MAKKQGKSRIGSKTAQAKAISNKISDKQVFVAHFRPRTLKDESAAKKMLAAAGLKPFLRTSTGNLVVQATR